jgi:hypothetical protein
MIPTVPDEDRKGQPERGTLGPGPRRLPGRQLPHPLDGVERQVSRLRQTLQHNGRRPSASLNFVTCHDGFTLRDLVSYNPRIPRKRKNLIKN